MQILKLLLGYWLEIGAGVLLLIVVEDVRWFLLYAFIIILLVSERQTDYLRKLVRVYQVTNEGKLLSIMRRMEITPEELQEIGDEVESTLTEKQRQSLYRDMDDLGLN